MKNINLVACIFLLCLSVGAQSKKDNIEDLNWLSGCWELRDAAKNRFVSEQWMKPAGGLMLGIGRTVKKEKAVDFEFMRIEKKGEDIFFVAKPKASTVETQFKLIRSIAFEAVFENPEHDFPQRVIYKRLGKKLTGRIEGNNNGKFLGIDFPMTKTSCD